MQEHDENDNSHFMTQISSFEEKQKTINMTPNTAQGINKTKCKNGTDLKIPDVQLFELLGEGGMGFVYKGKQTYIDRFVAVKVLKPCLEASFGQRFKREGKILAGLSHPNIVACYGAGVVSDGCYIVMEFIEGIDLYEYIKKKGTLPEKQALYVIHSLTQALNYAWDKGIMHRDIKAENVLLEKITLDKQTTSFLPDFPYRVKLVDLGLAKSFENYEKKEEDARSITQAGNILGTPSNMAPEQFDGDNSSVDHRADIYALGCVLYFMLTGKRAYNSKSLVEIIKNKITFPAPDPKDISKNISEKTRQLTKNLLQKEAKDRPQSYNKILDVLVASSKEKKKNIWNLIPLIIILMISIVVYKTVMYVIMLDIKNNINATDIVGKENIINNKKLESSKPKKNLLKNENNARKTPVKNQKSTSNIKKKKIVYKKVVWQKKFKPLFQNDYLMRLKEWKSKGKNASWAPSEELPGVIGSGTGSIERSLPASFWRIKAKVEFLSLYPKYRLTIKNKIASYDVEIQSTTANFSIIYAWENKNGKRKRIGFITDYGKKKFLFRITYKNGVLYFKINEKKLSAINCENPDTIDLFIEKASGIYCFLEIQEEKKE